jgi:hypothetical protein
MKKNTSKKKTQEVGKQGFASYIGIDLGDKSSDVCVLDAAGEKREEFRLRMKAAEFQAYFATIGPEPGGSGGRGGNRGGWRR